MLTKSVGTLNESSDILKESTDMSQESTGMLEESADMLQESVDMLEESADMSQESVDMLEESADMSQESVDMLAKSVLNNGYIPKPYRFPKIRISKSETRNKSQCPKSKCLKRFKKFEHSHFEFVSSFDIRISDFSQYNKEEFNHILIT